MPHDIDKLTIKENIFCIELVNTGDKYKAYDKANFGAKTKASRASSVSRLVRKQRVIAKLSELQEEVFHAGCATKQRVVAHIAEIAFNKSNTKLDRMRALELLGRSMAMFTDNVKQSGDGLSIKIQERPEPKLHKDTA